VGTANNEDLEETRSKGSLDARSIEGKARYKTVGEKPIMMDPKV
jgi:hypothetical protein